VDRSDDHLLSIQEVAKVLEQSVRSVQRMITDGEFPDGFPAPKAIRWRWGDVKDWIRAQKFMYELKKPPRQTHAKPRQTTPIDDK
jgi:predicted DNA-binding transcriptional regulator AlpA